MTDTIIKGTGNSRSIKSVPNLASLAPTYDKLLELLTSENGLPIDIGPLNLAGLDVKGTDLNKANLLTDATAALFGKGTSATPNDIFSTIHNLIEFGTYKGTGKTTKELNFLSSHKMILIIPDDQIRTGLFVRNSPGMTYSGTVENYVGKVDVGCLVTTWGPTSVSWSFDNASSGPAYSLNAAGVDYNYLAIG